MDDLMDTPQEGIQTRCTSIKIYLDLPEGTDPEEIGEKVCDWLVAQGFNATGSEDVNAVVACMSAATPDLVHFAAKQWKEFVSLLNDISYYWALPNGVALTEEER